MSAARRTNPGPATVLDAALWAIDLGLWPIAISPWDAKGQSPGKAPISIKNWGVERREPDYFRSTLRRYPHAGVGLKLGFEGRVVDVDVDDPEAAKPTLARLFPDGLPSTIRWDNAGGKFHLLFWYDDRLAELGKSIVKGGLHYPGLEIRIGAAPGEVKQIQSVIPPSLMANGVARRWTSWGDILTLPESVIQDLEANVPKPNPDPVEPMIPSPPLRVRGSSDGGRGNPETRAVAYLEKCEPSVSGQNGHDKALKTACKIGPGFGLLPDATFALLWHNWNPRCTPPWSENDLRRKVNEAFKVEPRRGWLLEANTPAPAITRAKASKQPPRPKLADLGNDPGTTDQATPLDGPTLDGRPEILIITDELIVNDQAIRALVPDPELYCRGPYLVTVRRDKRKSKLVNRPDESPWIASIPKASLREKMSHSARWMKTRRVPKSNMVEIVPTHPPDWSVAAVEARGEWEGIRHLEGLIEAPSLLADGSVLDIPGYDERSCLLYEPSGSFPQIPGQITREDAKRAAEELLFIVADFPFAVIGQDGGAAHRAAYLAGLLTPLARHAVDGPCPLFLADANVSAAGKSKLCDIVAILATGRTAARTAFPEHDEEMRKQILSIALEGDRLILIDNIATGSSLGGASLDGVLTGTTVKGRILGKTEMSREVPIYTVWYATGNNLGLKGDMLRRVVPYRLDSPDERPEERKDFRIKGDLLQHVKENRGRLVVAALTILRGFILAGKPKADLVPMDFPAWCDLVRQAVYWATDIDPCSTRRELIADDPVTNQLKALVTGWAELPDGKVGLTTAKVVKILNNSDHPEKYATIRGALMEWSRDGELPGPRSIGMRLKQIKGRVIEGLVLKSMVSNGTQSWAVIEAGPVVDKGTKGTKGTSFGHAGEIVPIEDQNSKKDYLAHTTETSPLSPLSPTLEEEPGWF